MIKFSRKLQDLADKKDFKAIKKIAIHTYSLQDIIDDSDGADFDANEALETKWGAFEQGVKAAVKASKNDQILFFLDHLDDGENIAYIAAKNLADAIAKVEKLPNRE